MVIEKLSLRGDANGDGVVNMDDVTFVTNIILGTEETTEEITDPAEEAAKPSENGKTEEDE